MRVPCGGLHQVDGTNRVSVFVCSNGPLHLKGAFESPTDPRPWPSASLSPRGQLGAGGHMEHTERHAE